jgi:hypothetical protein
MTKLILSGIVGYSRLHCQLVRSLDRICRAIEGFASEALSVEQRSAITLRLYDQRRIDGSPGLRPWEQAWYAGALPAPPAKILIGGCGWGREALVLCEQGYRVFAAEPAPALFRAACERLPCHARVWPLGYEHWVSEANCPAIARAQAELFAAAPFDAVVLGWGSLSHVLDQQLLRGLFPALARFCPSGPWLMSFLSSDAPRTERDRAYQWGRRWGLARRRGNGQARPPARERFLPHAGFVRTISEAEIQRWAETVGRRAEVRGGQGAYPHATLLRCSSAV